MPHSPGKFCLDINFVRWSLLNGVITRNTKENDPTAGRDLPVKNVTSIEKTTVTTVRKLPFGREAIILGIVLLAVCAFASALPARIAAGVIGIALIVWGAKRIPAITTVHEAYRIVAPGLNPDEWTVAGPMPEVLGFIEAVKSEMKEKGDSVRV